MSRRGSPRVKAKASPSPRKMKSEHQAIYRGKLPESASQDYLDPIYKKKDPIAASLKMRKEEGSPLSVVPGLRNPNQKPFFFTLRQVGEVPDIKKPQWKIQK